MYCNRRWRRTVWLKRLQVCRHVTLITRNSGGPWPTIVRPGAGHRRADHRNMERWRQPRDLGRRYILADAGLYPGCRNGIVRLDHRVVVGMPS